MDDDDRRGVLLPPVEGGSGTYASQGRFIDRLMGDRKIRAQARREVDELVRRSQEGVEELPPDAPPVKLPPPVPGGTRTATKGGRRLGAIRPRQAR